MRTPSRLLLAASIAVGLGLPPAADGADEKLWVGTVTYTSRWIEKGECNLQNEHCASRCKWDTELRLEFELFVVVAEGGVNNDPRPSNFRFEEHWVKEAEWQRFKKLCEKRPRWYYVQPGDSASETFHTENHVVGMPSFRVRLGVDQKNHKAGLSGEVLLQIVHARNHTGPSYLDPCTAGEDTVPLVPVPAATPTEVPVQERPVPFYAQGIVSDDLRHITFSPGYPTTREREENEGIDCSLPEAPLTRTCPEFPECARTRTNDQWELELPNARGEFWRCDDWAEMVRSQLLSELGDCFTSVGMLPTCVPALVTCVQAGRAWELCDWMQCPMDAAGEGQEELSECIDGAVSLWRRNDVRCR